MLKISLDYLSALAKYYLKLGRARTRTHNLSLLTGPFVLQRLAVSS